MALMAANDLYFFASLGGWKLTLGLSHIWSQEKWGAVALAQANEPEKVVGQALGVLDFFWGVKVLGQIALAKKTSAYLIEC